MNEDWIETRVQNRFTTISGTEMVSFDVKRPDGRNWAAPVWLVEKGLGGSMSLGMAVQIKTDDDRIKSVRRVGGPDNRFSVPPNSHQNRSEPRGTPRVSTSVNTRRQATILPYGFVSIDPAKAITDAPVWHDGKEGGELLSGELRCTLEALTPLLPGNARYKCTKEQADEWGFD